MKSVLFENGEYYHIFNRGTDKRIIFSENKDFSRFLQSIKEFNTQKPIGSIYEHSFQNKHNNQLGSSTPKLVEIICYCLNPNHYHLLLRQVSDNGVQKFMHKLGTGYTNYFNEKERRSGSLFQGRYKAIHIHSNEYLLHLSAYINLNDKVHRLGSSTPKSSWDEYMNKINTSGYCKKDIVLDQFESISDYKNFAEGSLIDIKERKDIDMEALLLE